jgi:hypothetical protein
LGAADGFPSRSGGGEAGLPPEPLVVGFAIAPPFGALETGAAAEPCFLALTEPTGAPDDFEADDTAPPFALGSCILAFAEPTKDPVESTGEGTTLVGVLAGGPADTDVSTPTPEAGNAVSTLASRD